MAKRKNWNRDELILAFNLYCKIEFSKINYKHPKIVELSNYIERTPSSVTWKLVNFASLDPSLKKKGIKGASNVAKMDKLIFEEFTSNWEDMIFESEKLRLKTFHREQDLKKIDSFEKEGKEALRTVKIRINQSFFRTTILAAYDSTCCITGLNIPELLVASHIIPWSKDVKNRLNPQNGLCLNNLHDKAFDKGLISFNASFELVLSKKIKEQQNHFVEKFFFLYEGNQLIMPKKFLPKKKFLEYHHKEVFLG